MSKLNAGLYSSESHTWMTPPALVNALLKFEGVDQFYIDPCCTEKNIPAKLHYQHPYMDGLALAWSGLVFMNPPYGNALKDWIQKAYEESRRPGCAVWALIPARTETQYQHDYGLTKAGFTVFLKGRLHFLQDGEDKGSAPFPTMLLYYGQNWRDKSARWISKPPLPGTLMIQGGVA